MFTLESFRQGALALGDCPANVWSKLGENILPHIGIGLLSVTGKGRWVDYPLTVFEPGVDFSGLIRG